jgi:hypothetical protein
MNDLLWAFHQAHICNECHIPQFCPLYVLTVKVSVGDTAELRNLQIITEANIGTD